MSSLLTSKITCIGNPLLIWISYVAYMNSTAPANVGNPPTYVHTDLITLLTAAQRVVDAARRDHPEEYERICAAAPWQQTSPGAQYDPQHARSPSCQAPPKRRPRDVDGCHLTEEDRNSTDVVEDATSTLSSSAHRRATAASRGLLPEELHRPNNTLWASLYRAIIKIQAPMVRCSRPAFRKVCRAWGTDVSYTHMLIADSFVKSPQARHAEFATYAGESRLIAQIAAKSGPIAAAAAQLLAPFCDAIDLNCGCPQPWAVNEGIGAALLEKPELVADMVHCIRNALPGAHAIPCVVKMRVDNDLRKSVDFARHCTAAGVGWLTVHGRTPMDAPTAAVRWHSISTIQDAVKIPVVANGGVSCPSSAVSTALGCHVGAVMAGSSLLDNPAAFYLPQDGAAMQAELTFQNLPHAASHTSMEAALRARPPYHLFARVCVKEDALRPLWSLPSTPVEVISDFLRVAMQTNLQYATTTNQALRMSRAYLSPAERSFVAVARSNTSVWTALQQVGLYTAAGRIHYSESPFFLSPLTDEYR